MNHREVIAGVAFGDGDTAGLDLMDALSVLAEGRDPYARI